MEKKMDINSFAQLIKNDRQIFAVYKEEKKYHVIEILFFGVTNEDGLIIPLVFDSEKGLAPADELAGWKGFWFGPIEHLNYDSY